MRSFFVAGEPLRGTSPQAAVRARDAVRDFLSAVVPRHQAQVDAVLIVVSELVTNAVRHAGGVTGLGLRSAPGSVTVCVEDASSARPRTHRTAPSQPGGFGWPMVKSLATDVRVELTPDGKAVQAVLPLAH
jgi:anti-sigma regulatory factor (Ser/Thr protein kinase)